MTVKHKTPAENVGASEGYIIPPKSETTVHSVVLDFFSASDEICPTPLK